ncbi:MAG: hypothetical protein K5686_09020 [Lachnospiraceae bacterium]|nr:hypothetical protein [Lachnospiraceae bacterium]
MKLVKELNEKLKNGALQTDEQGGLKGLKSVKLKIKIKGVAKQRPSPTVQRRRQKSLR